MIKHIEMFLFRRKHIMEVRIKGKSNYVSGKLVNYIGQLKYNGDDDAYLNHNARSEAQQTREKNY